MWSCPAFIMLPRCLNDGSWEPIKVASRARAASPKAPPQTLPLSGPRKAIATMAPHGVLPELLGMEKIVSEDAVRRGFKAIGEEEGREWLQRHLDYCTAPIA